jgi:hypothetical protein
MNKGFPRGRSPWSQRLPRQRPPDMVLPDSAATPPPERGGKPGQGRPPGPSTSAGAKRPDSAPSPQALAKAEAARLRLELERIETALARARKPEGRARLLRQRALLEQRLAGASPEPNIERRKRFEGPK